MECTAECETNLNFNLQIEKFAQVLTGVFSCRLVGHSPGRFCGSNSSKSILYEPYESAPEINKLIYYRIDWTVIYTKVVVGRKTISLSVTNQVKSFYTNQHKSLNVFFPVSNNASNAHSELICLENNHRAFFDGLPFCTEKRFSIKFKKNEKNIVQLSDYNGVLLSLITKISTE